MDTLFSRDALFDSVDTVKKNVRARESSTTYFPNGMGDVYLTSYPEEDYWNYTKLVYEYMTRADVYGDYAYSEECFNDLIKIVTLCRENNIELVAYISPIHVLMLEGIIASGKGEVYEKWKRRLAEIVPYYDFSGYNVITEDRYLSNEMYYFIDTSHCSPVVGEFIIKVLLGTRPSGLPENFYMYVDSDNVDDNIARLHKEREDWLRKESEFVQFAACFNGVITDSLVEFRNKEIVSEEIMFKVEGVKGAADFSDLGVFKKGSQLSFSGWFSYYETKMNISNPVIVFTAKETGKEYYCYVQTAEKGNIADLVKDFSGKGDGFLVDCRLNGIPDGDYGVCIAYADSNHVYKSSYAPFSIVIE